MVRLMPLGSITRWLTGGPNDWRCVCCGLLGSGTMGTGCPLWLRQDSVGHLVRASLPRSRLTAHVGRLLSLVRPLHSLAFAIWLMWSSISVVFELLGTTTVLLLTGSVFAMHLGLAVW